MERENIMEIKLVKVSMFKMPFSTHFYNRNQKVWVQKVTGSMAAKVIGKHRDKSKRYVSSWVNWDKKDRKRFPFPEFMDINVEIGFAEKYKLLIQNGSK